MRRIATIVGLFALLGVALAVGTMSTKGDASNNGIPNFLIGIDPCQSNGIAKSSVAINITSATTTQLVALSAGKTVYVCGYNFTIPNTVQTAQFETGTGATCSTPTVLTGAFAGGTTNFIVVGEYSGGTIFAAPSGQPVCILSTGATPSIQGSMTYVQQ